MLTRDNLRVEQKDCVEFMVEGYSSLILADVGTGKTVMGLTAVLELMQQGEIKRVIVFAPKRVCTDVWVQEISDWEHLHTAGLTAVCIAGKSAKVRSAYIEDEKTPIVVLNYENLTWFTENYPEPPFDALICDEVDKLKDRKTFRFKGRKWTDKKTKKERKYEGLKKYAKRFDTVIGLTGTPTSNHLLDLWAQAYVVDGGKALGKSFDKFRQKYFYRADYGGFDWQPFPGAKEQIYDKLSAITYRIERNDDIPEIVELKPRLIDMSKDNKKLYKKFERDFLVCLENGEDIESPNAAAARGKMLQIASGFAYTQTECESPQQVKRNTAWLHRDKFKELDDLISELQGQQLMIIYHFKSQLEELIRCYPRMRYLGGGVKDKDASETMRLWNADKLQLLALHPASAGHGLNLQKSSAHHIVFLTLPDSAGLYEQVVGRLRRTGSKAKSIFVHKILTRYTVEIEQNMKVEGKIKTQKEFLDAMKRRCSGEYV